MEKLLFILLIVMFSSCTTQSEKDYDKALWEHKTKMLEVEYIEKVSKTMNDLELKRTIIWLDSMRIEKH